MNCVNCTVCSMCSSFCVCTVKSLLLVCVSLFVYMWCVCVGQRKSQRVLISSVSLSSPALLFFTAWLAYAVLSACTGIRLSWCLSSADSCDFVVFVYLSSGYISDRVSVFEAAVRKPACFITCLCLLFPLSKLRDPRNPASLRLSTSRLVSSMHGVLWKGRELEIFVFSPIKDQASSLSAHPGILKLIRCQGP